MPGGMAKLDDPWGIAWRIRNRLKRASLRRSARFAAAYVRGVQYERPVFVIGAPRSGTSMLFELLKASSSLDGLPFEGHDVWRAFHHPRWSGWDSDVVGAGEVRVGERRYVNAYFHARLGPGRLVEKTPENCLRIPYLLELFPDASFVVIRRDPCEVISSLIDGWRHPAGRYRSYYVPERLNIPGHRQPRMWCFALVEGWRELSSAPIHEIAFVQWEQTTGAIERARPSVNPARWVDVFLEDLLESPGDTLISICNGIGVSLEPALEAKLHELVANPVNALSPPGPAKWRRRNQREITELLPRIAKIGQDRRYTVDPRTGDCQPRRPEIAFDPRR